MRVNVANFNEIIQIYYFLINLHFKFVSIYDLRTLQVYFVIAIL